MKILLLGSAGLELTRSLALADDGGDGDGGGEGGDGDGGEGGDSGGSGSSGEGGDSGNSGSGNSGEGGESGNSGSGNSGSGSSGEGGESGSGNSGQSGSTSNRPDRTRGFGGRDDYSGNAAQRRLRGAADAQSAIRSGKVRPLSEVLPVVRRRYKGRIIGVDFGSRHGVLVYRVKVVGDAGRVLRVDIDARTKRIIAIGNY